MSEENIFAGVNFSEGSDNPFGLEKGTHEVSISDFNMERSAKGNLGLWVTFSAENGKTIRKWTTMPEPEQAPDDRERNTSFLRMLLRQLEIPEDRWETLTRDDFIGIDCIITVVPQPNSDYFSVKRIARARGSRSHGTESGLSEFTRLSDKEIKESAQPGLGF